MSNTAEARVVASFTFVVVLMLGAWGALDQLVTALLAEPEVGGLLIALLPVVATAVAFQAARAASAAWARMLGSATVMLGAVSCAGALLYFLARY